ncbi:hypothetical protein AHF37_04744 [Paragonimus kellicotti]|nr:hypothetical protein AHF37_04744 [Paragonimus kellicotti]
MCTNPNGWKTEPISGNTQQVKATLPTCTEAVVARDVELHLDLLNREIQRLDDNSESYWSFIKEFQIAIDGKTTDNQPFNLFDSLLRRSGQKPPFNTALCWMQTKVMFWPGAFFTNVLVKDYMVARPFIDEFLNGLRLSPEGLTALIHLTQQMRVCNVMCTQLKYDSDLTASRTTETIVRRFPSPLCQSKEVYT